LKIVNNIEPVFGNFGGTKTKGQKSFAEVLDNALKTVNTYQNEYESLLSQQVIGDEIDLHNVVIAGEKAKISLELTLQIRNKVMEAYQEIMRMQI
jgi:flagellar hook-basal body complex protein FliE